MLPETRWERADSACLLLILGGALAAGVLEGARGIAWATLALCAYSAGSVIGARVGMARTEDDARRRGYDDGKRDAEVARDHAFRLEHDHEWDWPEDSYGRARREDGLATFRRLDDEMDDQLTRRARWAALTGAEYSEARFEPSGRAGG